MRAGFDEVVLVTGFPSFAARKMCEELVLRSDARTFVHAIVPSEAEDAFRDLVAALPSDRRDRIDALEGDAASMDLGLAGAELEAIAPEIDRIHHMANASSLITDRKAAERRTIGSAREILEVAAVCPALKCLIHHSTAHVSGNRAGLVLEGDLAKGQEFQNVAEETAARAEKMIRAAMHKIPSCVVRPTVVVGDARTGEVDRESGAYYLLLLVITASPDLPLPLPGRLDAYLHLVPVDYYVRAASVIGRDARAPGRTFHIGDPTPRTLKRVVELVTTASGRRMPRGFIPANLTKALLRAPGIDRLSRSPRAFLDTLATPVSYSFANTTELLADTDVRCPPFESYVDRLVDHAQNRLREKRAREAEVEDPLV